MNVTVLIITHGDIGSALVRTTTKVMGELPLPTIVVNTEENADPETLLPKLHHLIDNVGTPEGILILTDLFGSTPSNVAKALNNEFDTKIICGVNLPMLMRIMNYANSTLDQLVEKALAGGKDGVREAHN